MAPSPDRTYDIARVLLDAVIAEYAASACDVPLPSRRYVAHNIAAWDCEQVTVWVEQTYTQGGALTALATSMAAPVQAALRSADFVVEVVRNHPTVTDSGEAPEPADMEAVAKRLLADGQIIANALHQAHKARTTLGINNVILAGITPAGPDGGLAAIRVRCTVGLSG